EWACPCRARHDLAHVSPDDLRGDALHDHDGGDEFEDEEIVSERVVEEAKPLPKEFATPKTTHMHPINGNGNEGENGHANGNGNGNGHANGNGKDGAKFDPLAQSRWTGTGVTVAPEEKVRQARMKGYEGDPCPECGQLTLVRSGACCKCDSCGASSGCS